MPLNSFIPHKGRVLRHCNETAYILRARAICVGLWKRTIRENLPLSSTWAKVGVKYITPPLVSVSVCWLATSSTIYLPALFKMNPSSGRIVRVDRRVCASSFVCVLCAGVSVRAFVRMCVCLDFEMEHTNGRSRDTQRKTHTGTQTTQKQAGWERELAQRKYGWTRNTGIAPKANQDETREEESDRARRS